MPVPKITATQFEQSIASGIATRDSRQKVEYGPIRDIVCRAPAGVLEAQNERVRSLFQLLSLTQTNTLQPADIDAFVFNEQVLRSQGTSSFVTLTFFRKTLPTTNLTIPANFPVGTVRDPVTGAQITYVTMTPVTLIAANASAYFNGATNRYELEVTSGSVTTGGDTSVGRDALKIPLRPLSGFDGVTNTTESIGGLPAETNQQVADRYVLRVRGTELGTPPGLSRYTRQTFGSVQDLYIVYGSDPFLVRAAVDAGAIDAWVLGSSPVQRTMVVPFPGKLIPIPFDKQPGVEIVSVQSGVTYTQNVDYQYYSDPGIWSRSTRGSDGVIFVATGAAPAIGDPVTITYKYDNLIIALQSFFTMPEYYETGRDALFRRGIQVDIAITGELKVNAGNPLVVQSQAAQALLDYFNGNSVQHGLLLNQNVEEFDLDDVLSRVPGVDNFTYTLLAPVGSTGVQPNILMQPNQYARLNIADLTITLV
jgi:hypothetical protein